MFQGKFVSMETRRCSTHNCVSRGGGRREEFEERREIWVVEVVPPPPHQGTSCERNCGEDCAWRSKTRGSVELITHSTVCFNV